MNFSRVAQSRDCGLWKSLNPVLAYRLVRVVDPPPLRQSETPVRRFRPKKHTARGTARAGTFTLLVTRENDLTLGRASVLGPRHVPMNLPLRRWLITRAILTLAEDFVFFIDGSADRRNTHGIGPL